MLTDEHEMIRKAYFDASQASGLPPQWIYDFAFNLLAVHNAGAQEPVAWAVYNGWCKIAFYMSEEGARDHVTAAQRSHDLSGSLAAFRAIPLYTNPQPITDAAWDVLAERHRQVTVEGWTPAHDDERTGCSLAVAAACYALFAAADNSDSADAWLQEWRKTARYLWPYDKEWQKTTTPRRDLVKAGALILAEIERLDRAKGGL